MEERGIARIVTGSPLAGGNAGGNTAFVGRRPTLYAMEKSRPTSLRFPPALAHEIREQARRDDRAFSGQVVHLLRASLNSSAGIDEDEIERLASICREAIHGEVV
jgi:hypothetical protein